MSICSWIKRLFSVNYSDTITAIPTHLLTDDKKLMPTKAHWDDSGYDLRSAETRTIILRPGDTAVVGCGFVLSLPVGYEAQIRPRSGLALKHHVTVLNTPGTVDSGYRGEVKVILTNFGKVEFKVRYGDRIAQMVISQVPQTYLDITETISDTERGSSGFGSTGVQ